MIRVVLEKPNKIYIIKAKKPLHLRNNEVLLRIKRIGICGSDISVFKGKHPAVTYPVIQGYEYSAIVEEVGSSVDNFYPGMVVTGRPQRVCGHCNPCKYGQYNVCDNLNVEGFQAPSVAQDYFVIDKERIIPLPENVSLDVGAVVEPLAVAIHAVNRSNNISGKNIIINGAGTIGNLVGQYAKIKGAKKVLITDLSDHRLEIAQKFGIDNIFNISKGSYKKNVNSIFENEGFQIGFEAAGVEESLDNLMKNIEKGRQIIVIGVYAEDPKVNMYYLGEHELELKGTLMYLHQDYLEAVDFISSRTFKLSPLISKHFSLT